MAGYRQRFATIGLMGLSLVTAVMPASTCLAAESQALTPDAAAGERIYRDGLLTNGTLLQGKRADGVTLSGAAAACINCHRASGFGGAEGNLLIPPITGAVLMSPGQPWTQRAGRASANLARSEHSAHTRPAYTPATFSQALTEGQSSIGRSLGYLMPRYALDSSAINQLRAYLDTLGLKTPAGVDPQALHLATIVTDDAPTEERNATLNITSRCLSERSPKASSDADAARPWQWHVWRLGRDPSQWAKELAAHQRQQPVFAVISGVSGGAWAPIHAFCEQQKLPCILPNTAAVDDMQTSHWSFYFSRGLSLEAAALAQRMADAAPPGGWRRIIQRTDGSAPAILAATALSRHLQQHHIDMDGATARPQRLNAIADRALASSLSNRDALVLWVNRQTLQAFTRSTPAPGSGLLIFSSELTGSDDAPISAAWRARSWLIYPFDTPARQLARITVNTNDWMDRSGLSLTPRLSALQGNTYSACEVAARALQTMRGHYSQEYFLELVEASDEAAIATAYPRFSLGPSQRYGSKGAFILKYAAPDFKHLQASGDWITPP